MRIRFGCGLDSRMYGIYIYYIHVTVPGNRFIFKYPTRRTNYPNLFCYKTLHVSGIFSAQHQEFSTVHSAPVSFMQVFDDRFQAESGWNCSSILTLLGSGHQKLQFHPDSAWKRSSKICMKLTSAEYKWRNPDDGQRGCPKHVEFYDRINLDN